jgi:hypothetical protein
LKLTYWLIVVAFFTASCDKVLNFNVGGSLRLAQILMIGVCIAAFAKVIQTGRILWPRGSTALALWMFVQAMFIPLSGVMTIGLTFFALLLFTVVSVLAVVQLYGESEHIESLMRMYLLSYVAIAVLGLFQFGLPVVGLPSFDVIQWIVHDRLPRINVFSYEPSYFATYMTMGWIMLVELRFSRARMTQGKLWKWATILVTAALVLSTSKTAWAFMLLEIVLRGAPHVWIAVRRVLAGLRRGLLILYLPSRRFVFNSLVLLVLLAVGARFVTHFLSDPRILLSGTGLAHQPAHSLNDRVGVARQTLDAYLEHPFIGRSLGGVSAYIASRNGVQITSIEMVRKFWGFPVIMDVLVASGLFGFIPFLVYLYANTFGALKLATRYWPAERAKWMRALARAMIFEWLTLMVDQNLLRVYLWFHFTMVAVVAYNLEFVMVHADDVTSLSAAHIDAGSRDELDMGDLGEPAAAV